MKVGSVEIYNLTKVPRIWHQNDRELMIFHPIYDSIRLDLENQKGPKCVLIRPPPFYYPFTFELTPVIDTIWFNEVYTYLYQI